MSKKKNPFLEKVEHFIEEPPYEPEPPKQEKPVSQRNRNMALLRYLTLMFVVAFVLVLISFLQQRDSRQTISELNQNASSALIRAEQLQEDNRGLSQQNMELSQHNVELTGQLSNLENQLEQALAELEVAKADLEQTNESYKALQTELEAMKTNADTDRRTYELLLTAQKALENAEVQEYADAMHQLSELTEHLDANGKELYQQLLTAGSPGPS